MPRVRLVAGAILLALALVVVTLRFHRLSELPPGLYYDEGAHGVDALQVLQGKHAVFFPQNYGREGLIVYGVAASTAFLGRSMLALRLPTALASAGAVFVVFWLGRLLFGRDEEDGQAAAWRGLLIGGIGAGLLAASLSQTVLGRTAFRVNYLVLLLPLCLALLWWGWRRRSWSGVALAGACAGSLLYTYTTARVTPLLFLVLGISFLVSFGSDAARRTGTELPMTALFVGVAALTAAPILVYFALNPEQLFLRSSQLWIFNLSLSDGNPWGQFLDNLWGYVASLGVRGDMNWRHNLPGQPLLDPWQAVFFWLGAGVAVRRWKRPAYRLLLLWLGLLILPTTLAVDTAPPPNTLRIFGSMPAIYLLAAVGMWEAFRFLERPLRAMAARAGFSFRADGVGTALAVVVVVGGLILVQGVRTYRLYFQRWAAAPELHVWYEMNWTILANALNEQQPDAGTVYLLPRGWHDEHPGFVYLYQGAAAAHVIDSTLPSLAQKIESVLASAASLSTVRVLEWTPDPAWPLYGFENIIALLEKYGSYQDSGEIAAFQFHEYSGISLDGAWTAYEELEPLTVIYDGGISLHGIALGHGEKQLARQPQVDLGGERSMWLALQWQTAPGLEIDYRTSLRLHNADDARVYQDDVPLLDLNSAQTSQWKAGEPVDNQFHLELPADLPPGEYELRVVVYDSETKKPTAQLDVWNTEIVLARLHLEDAQ